MHILGGLLGPKCELGPGRIRPFPALKGGFTKFELSRGPVAADTVIIEINSLRTSNVNAMFYPGGGLEGHVGPIGLRQEAGHEVTFTMARRITWRAE